MSLVSIVTPAYNAESYIVKTVASVLEQTHADWEMIIVDDGSTDLTWEVMQQMNADPRIKIIQQQNGGVSSARNEGLKHAKGMYVAFLDADDLWDEKFLETALKTFENEEKLGVVIQKERLIDENGQPLGSGSERWIRKVTGFLTEVHYPERGIALQLFFLLGFTFPPCRMVIKNRFESLKKGFDTSLHGTEDSDLLMRLASEGAVFAFLDIESVSYRKHSSSASLNAEKMAKNLLMLLEKNRSETLKGKEFPEWAFKLQEALITLRMGRLALRKGDAAEWKSSIKAAETLMPSAIDFSQDVVVLLRNQLIDWPGAGKIIKRLGGGLKLRIFNRAFTAAKQFKSVKSNIR